MTTKYLCPYGLPNLESRGLKKLNPELLGDVEAQSVSWAQFKEHFLPILQDDEKVVGINLSGKNLTGIDIPASILVTQVEAFG